MNIIEISALEISSVQVIKNKLISNINIINTHTNTVVSNSRHLNALKNALSSLINVEIGIDNNLSTDLLSIDIRKCIDSIGEITGEVTNDDILGNIFANFCIGK